MLTAYADESGHAADPHCRHLGVVGLVTSTAAWAQLDAGWRNMLDSHGVAYMHMREFAHTRGAYQKWSEKQRQSFFAEALALIEGAKPIVLGSVINLGSWNALPAFAKVAFVNPYHACVQEFSYLSDVHGVWGEQKPVSIVFSQVSEFASRGRLLHEALMKKPHKAGSIAEIRYGDPHNEVALQAADTAAYEVVLAHDRRAGGSSRTRYGFKRLWQLEHFVRYIDGDYLKWQVEGIPDGLRSRPAL